MRPPIGSVSLSFVHSPNKDGEIMGMTNEPGGRSEQMRAKAQEMKDLAERTSDPAERKRLTDKARRLQEQSDGESGQAMGREDMNPR